MSLLFSAETGWRNLRTNGAKLRWGMLMLFVAGYAVTRPRFENVAGEYLVYHLLAIGACAVLFTQLKAFEQRYAAVWLGLIIIALVYFLRFYWIAIDPSPLELMLYTPAYKAVMQDDALFQAFKLSVMTLAVFSFSAAAMLFLLRQQGDPGGRAGVHRDAAPHWVMAKLTLLMLPPIMLALAYLAHRYHIGELGAAAGEPLPLRLKGVVFYARFILVPMMILFLIYLAERCGHAVVARLGILLLVAHGVSDMLIRNSRGSLLVSMLLLVFLVMAGGLRLHRNEKALVGVTIMLAFIIIPIMTEYRYHRTLRHLPAMDALYTAVVVTMSGGGWGLFKTGLMFALFRLPGVEVVAAILGLGAQPLGAQSIEVLGSGQGLAGYLTHDIYQMHTEWHTLAAPGFVGWLYLVAGAPAVALGAAAAAIFAVLGWKFLGRTYLECGPVAQAFLLWILFVALTEGTLDTMGYMVLAGIASIVVFEFGLRLARRSVAQRALG